MNVARLMESMAPERYRSVAYWEASASWYGTWLGHNDYHASVKGLLAGFARPGWRVLDIGGGSGVLSSFLCKRGCRTILLEPARAMRDLFISDAPGAPGTVDGIWPIRWEDTALSDIAGFDLIVACNSLHVTGFGFAPALAKVFDSAPAHVCVVAEEAHATGMDEGEWPGYELTHGEARTVASSLAYHSIEEAEAHAAFRAQKALNSDERRGLRQELVFERGHHWLKGTARVHLRWWSRSASDPKGRS
jgi:hypothetical protein